MRAEIQVKSLGKRGGGACCLVAEPGLTLLPPMDCSPPGSSAHEGAGKPGECIFWVFMFSIKDFQETPKLSSQ